MAGALYCRGPPMIRMVACRWRDAHFDFSESDGLPGTDDYVVVTLGFLVGSGPRFLSIASERLPDGSFRATSHVPIESVLGLIDLAKAEGRTDGEDQAS